LPIEVLKWGSDRHSEGVNLYVTVGWSEHSADSSQEHRVEFFTGFIPENDEIARPLAMLGDQDELLDHGHTVSFQEPLWPATSMRTFLVLRPRVELIPVLVFSKRLHVDFLQAIPIYPTELNAKKRSGLDALLARWEKHKVPFWDPQREANPSGSEAEA